MYAQETALAEANVADIAERCAILLISGKRMAPRAERPDIHVLPMRIKGQTCQ